jgi:predicted alpha/beta-hydrolase family hydrolase
MNFSHAFPLAALITLMRMGALAENAATGKTPQPTSKEIASRTIEDGGTGRHKAIMASDSSLPTHTVFRPEDLSQFGDKSKLPIVAWGNGACANSPWEHVNFLSEIASHGYLLVAIGPMPAEGQRGAPGGPTKSWLLSDAINWAIARNADKASQFHQKLDTNKIVVAGMSCGGLQALEVATDPRVSTVIVCNSGLFTNPANARPGMPNVGKDQLAKLHTPTLDLLGGEKDIAYKNGMDDVQRINHVPIFAANLEVGHGGTYSRPHGGEFAKVAVGWLQWQLRKDEQAGKMFLGDPCRLAKEDGWKVEKKKIP